MTLGPRYLPGDPPPAAALDRMIRVDHAGEMGAERIYEGQIAVLGKGPKGNVLRHMAEQEKAHKRAFDEMLPRRRVRPTIFAPLWHVAGYALGRATAGMGETTAMACTVAVEEVIDDHYADQAEKLRALGGEEELVKTVERFRAEELEHRDLAIDHGAENAPGSPVVSAAIKAGSKLAIWLSERF